VSALQEKTAQLALGIDSASPPPCLPPSCTQHVPPYEQLTQEQNVWFSDGSARYVKEKLQWKAATFETAGQTFLTYQGKGGAANTSN